MSRYTTSHTLVLLLWLAPAFLAAQETAPTPPPDDASATDSAAPAAPSTEDTAALPESTDADSGEVNPSGSEAFDAATPPSNAEEEALFGDPPANEPSNETPPLESDLPLGEAEAFGGGDPTRNTQRQLEADLVEADERLQFGGMMYLRADWAINDSNDLADQRISMPGLVELYADTRPSDRLRGFVRTRLNWDPTVTEGETDFLGNSRDNVSVQLDELWLKLDIERAVYVTLGQQHVRWGVSHLWNPIDVLNRSRREPLQPFDTRTGVPLLKLHMPIESLGWNFYVIGMLDEVSSLERAGVAGRAEFVFSTVELGVTSAWRDGIDPKLGLDISAGLWDVDVTSELGLTFDGGRPKIQVTGGLRYGIRYSDEDALYIGAEYFYNEYGEDTTAEALYAAVGASTAEEYVAAVATAVAAGDDVPSPQFFYNGRHYAAFYLALPGPGEWDDTSFLLSTIGNLSDQSFVTRFDFTLRAMTYLSLQLYVQGHYGNQGELRVGPEAVPDDLKSILESLSPDRDFPDNVQILETGLSLRLDL